MSEVEHAVKVFPITDNLQEDVKKLEAEGWRLIPGIVPIVIYHLARAKDDEPKQAQGIGTLTIDDSKVIVVKDGKKVN